MLGQLEGYNSRENRLRKQRLYKEMLDNQILMNRRFKKQQSQQYNRSYGQISSREINRRERKKGEIDDILDTSFVHRLRESRETVGQLYLPNLEDRNMFYRGTSRYIPSDEPHRIDSIKRIKTEIIEADQSPYDDPIIQRLIEQLQVMNKSKFKPHTKRVKHLNYMGRREKKQNYQSNNASPTKQSVPISFNQITNENVRKKLEGSKPFASFLQKISELPQMQRNADSQLKNDRIDRQLEKSKKYKNRQRLLSNRQSFLQTLRKVKERGESLHIKFSKNLDEIGKDQKKANI